ncbi:hypothetical protein, partial [Anaerovibrio lipolyticus]
MNSVAVELKKALLRIKTMASYHLRIKPSKRKDKTKIDPKEHLDYIARKGKYKKLEQEEIRQLDENYIYADEWNKEIP